MRLTLMDDASIIRGLRQGDAAAAAQLVDLYGNRLLRAAYLLCRNETEAQDLVQETLLQAVKSAGRFRETSAFFSWLYGILLNVYRCQHRKQEHLLLYTDAMSEMPDDEADQGNFFDRQDTAGILWKALGELSAEHREALILRYYEGMSIDEIARWAGLSTGTVKSRLFYGIRRLRKKYLKK